MVLVRVSIPVAALSSKVVVKALDVRDRLTPPSVLSSF